MVRRKTKCPECKKTKFWKTGDGRLKCKKCRKMFTAKRNPYGISSETLKEIVSELLLEHSTDIILDRVKISKYKLLKVLTLIRVSMTRDVPEVFKGIVEVDETYLGGKCKNKRLKIKAKSPKSKRGRGTTKQPVFGILCRDGKVWAKLVQSVEASDLQPRIEKQVEKGATICSDTWRGYTGIAAKGYVHRTVEHGKNEYSDKKGNHINGLEGFWGYLKRKLASKGGIRREKLHLYLGEYVWRYNHRKLDFKSRKNRLIDTLFRHYQVINRFRY